MQKLLRCSLFAGTIGLFCAAPVHATVIADEPFNYTAGAGLTGQTGGTGFGANAWTAPTAGSATITAGSLSYTDTNNVSVGTSGNKVNLINNGSGAGRRERLLDAAETLASRTVWISCIMELTSGATNTTGHAGYSLMSGGTEILFMGKPAGTNNWGLALDNGATTQLSTISAVNSTAFLLARIVSPASGTASISFWVNPPIGSEAGLPAPTVTTSHNVFSVDALRVSTNVQTTGINVDEVRFADTFSEVVPEPASIGLTSIAGLALLARRRRTN
jgi:hypothetical protein